TPSRRMVRRTRRGWRPNVLSHDRWAGRGVLAERVQPGAVAAGPQRADVHRLDRGTCGPAVLGAVGEEHVVVGDDHGTGVVQGVVGDGRTAGQVAGVVVAAGETGGVDAEEVL